MSLSEGRPGLESMFLRYLIVHLSSKGSYSTLYGRFRNTILDRAIPKIHRDVIDMLCCSCG